MGDPAKKAGYQAFAESQIDYILGDNPNGRSYLMGFGVNPPINPHHRTGHGAWYNDIKAPADNEHILTGALVGGPDARDNYEDDRTDYQRNEVALDYNAALIGSLARMHGMYGGDPLTEFPVFKTEAERRDGYFVRARITSEAVTGTGLTFQLSNRSAWPATVKDSLSFRYFFDLAELYDAGFTADDVAVTLGSNEGATVSGPHPWGGTVYYAEVDFTGTKIFPGGRAESEKLALIEISAPGAWDGSNDWSRQNLVTNPFTYEPVDLTGQTPYVPVYDAGVLLWGTEPDPNGPPHHLRLRRTRWCM